MTDEELPTAATIDSFDIESGAAEINLDVVEEGDELKRRKDIVEFIEQRVEKWRKKKEETSGLQRADLNDAKARLMELEDLLEEVQSENV